jgi:hypothetical protein
MNGNMRILVRQAATVAKIGVFVALALAAQPARADGPGVHGRVMALGDRSQITGVVPGASIEFKSQAGQVVAQVKSDQNGYYKANLPPGNYAYKVQAAGFKDENAGRGIKHQLSEGYAVYNFSLVKGKTDPDQKPPVIPMVEVGTLQGRVLEKTREGLIGIPGARIVLRHRQGAPRPEEVISGGGSEKTGGQYQIVLEAGSYQASVSATGFQTLVDPNPIEILAGKTTNRDFVLVRTQPVPPAKQGIQGRISFAGPPTHAIPLSAVTLHIEALTQQATTEKPFHPEPDGHYRRELATGTYRVTAEAKGYQTAQSGPRVVIAGKYTVVDLTLVRTTPPTEDLTFVGLVFERLPAPKGRSPLPGATVLLRKQGEPMSAALSGTTNQSGEVRIKVSAAGPYQALARKAGYEPAGASVDIRAGGPNRTEIELTKTGISRHILTVLVHERRDEFPQPIAGANVIVNRAAGGQAASGSTDRMGKYTVELPSGNYTVEVSKAGFETASVQAVIRDQDVSREVVLKKSTGLEHRLILKVVESLRGQQMAPVPGVQITVLRAAGGQAATGITDRSGGFSTSLPDGSYTVEASKAGYEKSSLRVTLSGQDVSRQITLSRTSVKAERTLTVLVRQPRGATTMPVFEAKVAIRGPDTRFLGETNSEGKVSTKVVPGTYTVEVSKAEFQSANLQITVGDQDVSRTIVLQPKSGGTPHKLTVLAKSRFPQMTTPLPQAKIVIDRSGGGQAASGVTDREGKYTATLPAGSYTVTGSAPNCSAGKAQVTITDQDASCEVILIPQPPPLTKHILTLTVREQRGNRVQPLAGAQATVSKAAEEQVASGATDRMGQFKASLPAGSYAVQVTKEGYKPSGVRVVIGEQDVSREVVLTSATPPAETQAMLTLRIVQRKAGAAGMTPVLGAAVVIKRGNQVFKQSQSGPDGMARIQLPAGTYQIEVSKVAFTTVRLDMTMGQTDITRDVELRGTLK